MKEAFSGRLGVCALTWHVQKRLTQDQFLDLDKTVAQTNVLTRRAIANVIGSDVRHPHLFAGDVAMGETRH